MSAWYLFFKGRVALYAILKAMGIGAGDRVLLPGFTCVVVPNAVNYLGATPTYVDVDLQTYNMDPQKVEEEFQKDQRGRIKAIVAQSTYGIPADMDRIRETAARHGAYVIEDSCHAMGSKYKGKEVGKLGDAAFFSSQWSKPITTGIGGWAVINNPELRPRMEKAYQEFVAPLPGEVSILKVQYYLHTFLTPSLFWIAQGAYRALSNAGIAVGSSSKAELECRMPDNYKKRMSTWQQKKLEERLKNIDRVIEHRKWVVSRYERLLPEIDVEPLKFSEDFEPVFLKYPVMVKDKKGLLQEARRKGIEIGDWFVSPVHPNLDGWEKVGYRNGMCPVAEHVCDHVINLPTHEKIDQREVKKIFGFLKSIAADDHL